MLNLYRQAYYSYKGLFMWLNWPGYISTLVFRPVFNVFIFALVGKFALNPAAAQSYILGMAAFQIPFVVMGGVSQCFTYERSFGTLSFVYVSSGSRWTNYLSKGLFHYPNGLVVVTLSLLAGWVFLSLDFSQVNWLTLVITILIIGISSLALSLLIGNFSIIFEDWATVYGATHGVLIALTGVIIPVASLPWFLSEFSQILPLTHGLVAFRQAFTGSGLMAARNDLLFELLIGIVYGTLGFIFYKWMEKEAKQRGVLDTSVAS